MRRNGGPAAGLMGSSLRGRIAVTVYVVSAALLLMVVVPAWRAVCWRMRQACNQPRCRWLFLVVVTVFSANVKVSVTSCNVHDAGHRQPLAVPHEWSPQEMLL